MTGLIRRNGRYSTRRVIPFDLQAHYCRREIVRALGTADPAQARKLHHAMWGQLEAEFDRVRTELHTGDDGELFRPIEVEKISPTVVSLTYVDDLRAAREAAAERGELKLFMATANDALRVVEAMLNGETDAAFPLPVLEGRRNALRSFLTGDNSLAIAAARKTRQTLEEEKKAQTSLPLTEVIERWAKEVTPTPRTIRKVKDIIAAFSKATGITNIKMARRSHVIQWKDTMIAQGQTAANINVKIPILGTIFNFAVKNDLIESNPASLIRVADNRRAKEKRRPFTETELSIWFSSPIYVHAERPDAGAGEAAYWLPLLALYTGARQTELGQLYPDDVRQEEYQLVDGTMAAAWVIRLVENDERGQRVKTEGSERRIPIHSDLVGLGFLDFVEKARRKNKRIFSAIQPNAQGELMGNWSKWFGRYRRKLGIKGKDVTFHSFRHNFKDNARLAGIHSEVHNALTGHETGEVSTSYGGLSYPLRPLVEAMALYRVPNFKLPARL